MEDFHHIFGLCFLLTGSTAAFLLQRPNTTHSNASIEWGEWKVIQEYPICFVVRTRQCISEGCTKDEKEYKYCKEIASWGEWGPLQCTIKANICFIARGRNCSIMALPDCRSNETNQDVTVWGDFKSCPCRGGNTNVNGQGNGHWEEWNKWQCSTINNHCYVYRTRQCSGQSYLDCPPSGGSQTKLWTDNCPCQKDPSSSGSSVIPINGALSSASWLEWGSWECHHVNTGCMMVRRRLCSTNESDCIGESYQLDTCKADFCNGVHATTTGPAIASIHWSPWECHRDQIPCVLYRHQMCASQSGSDILCTDNHFEIKGCDETCIGSSTSGGVTGSHVPSTVMSYITAVTSGIFTSSLYTASTSIGPTSAGLISSTLPSSNSTSIGLTYNIGITSSSTPLASASSGLKTSELPSVVASSVAPCNNSVCPAWTDWGIWRCRLGNNGTCSMSRTRECSTGTSGDCSKDALMTRPCNATVCPDKVKLEQSGQCRNYVSGGRHCVDYATSCDTITDPFHPICRDEHVSHDLCPTACGCCEEIPYWLEWSAWECNLAPNHTCEMNRTRICSTGSLDDCVGKSAMKTSCSDTVCKDYQATKCLDHRGCLVFKTDSDLDIICSEPKMAAECPVTCGCCEMPHWLEWSAWKCHLAPNHTCEMLRIRNCSTGSLHDCVGKSAMKTSCSNTVCPEIINLSTQVDCSAVGSQATKCVDGPGCSEFKSEFLLKLLCSDPTTVAECPVTCGCCGLPHWLEWSAWECHMTQNRNCEIRRTRNCSTGSLDDCVGISTVRTNCSDIACPVNGKWAEWQEWSKCSHSCSGGNRKRVRTCSNPAPSHGGNDCAGEKTESDSCNIAKCPEWSQWFYGACSVTCGNGTTMRLRHCSSGKDLDCGTGNAFESTTCNEIPCI